MDHPRRQIEIHRNLLRANSSYVMLILMIRLPGRSSIKRLFALVVLRNINKSLLKSRLKKEGQKKLYADDIFIVTNDPPAQPSTLAHSPEGHWIWSPGR